MKAVETTRQRAAGFLGNSSTATDADLSVVVVESAGSYSIDDLPRGIPATSIPTYKFMYLILDAVSGDQLGSSLTYRQLRLEDIGSTRQI